MADDGMLLNFDTSASPAAVSKPRLTGGHWRDRLKAKKGGAVGRRDQRGSGNSVNFVQLGERKKQQSGEEEEEYVGPAAKRQRVEDTRTSTKQAQTRQLGERPVVSSLFTFNPKPQNAAADGNAGDVPDAKPSNAPLPEGAANFTSLGLSGELAAHLLTKLDLKAPTAIQKATLSQLLQEDSDAFIQAETGSGKTLAYLLPIVQRLMALSKTEQGKVHRDSGLFAIIMAPTRELCRQIQNVLDSLLRCAHWIVAGSVTGGERKKSEKARLRKGINILVATPGRLADHLQNTSVLDVSNVRWLVMDEGDRLMELGFEQEIKGIVDALEKKANGTLRAGAVAGASSSTGALPRRRITILCSATMKMTVQRLGEVSLKDAVHIQSSSRDETDKQDPGEAKFMAPAQMKQSYIIVPAKQRLVTLTALLRKTFARRGSVMKAIIFLSCADSVDFHFEVLRRGADEEAESAAAAAAAAAAAEPEPQQTASPPPSSPEPVKSKKKPTTISKQSSLNGPLTSSRAPILTSTQNPNLSIFRLHGSLAQPVRTSTLRAFSATKDSAILLCTDVASRGLDLPSIDLVVEYDPAFSAEDHLHRVGRTARAGKEGRAILFLMPGPEEGYVELLEKEGQGEEGGKRRLGRLEVDDTLKRGFSEDAAITATKKAQSSSQIANDKFQRKGTSTSASFVPSSGTNKAWEQRATEWQLEAERWTAPGEKGQNRRAHDMAERAYKSSVAAYATHVKPERHMFDVAQLHLGHLAKAFALRDKPSNFGRAGMAAGKKRERGADGAGKARKSGAGAGGGDSGDEDGKPQRRNASTVDEDVMAKMRKLARARERDQAGEFNFG